MYHSRRWRRLVVHIYSSTDVGTIGANYLQIPLSIYLDPLEAQIISVTPIIQTGGIRPESFLSEPEISDPSPFDSFRYND